MPGIQKRKIVNTMYRLRFRPDGLPPLSMTFSSEKEAKDWIEKHEQSYLDNPKKYHNWLKANRKSLKINGIFHVHIPLRFF
jgi:hypothetical protein